MNLYHDYGLTLEEGNQAMIAMITALSENTPRHVKETIATLATLSLSKKQLAFSMYMFCTKPYMLGAFVTGFKDKIETLGKQAAIQSLEEALAEANKLRVEEHISKNN